MAPQETPVIDLDTPPAATAPPPRGHRHRRAALVLVTVAGLGLLGGEPRRPPPVGPAVTCEPPPARVVGRVSATPGAARVTVVVDAASGSVLCLHRSPAR
ncbi:hypothetical protein AWW66_01285 [Micromonospora rosaria]|uniref:Uncharacterized protein n=1 Tax=Micromonospora rosaria TaxID=47874 RepID=A0A136PZG5_9ACTN|nr:hypothetical protein [Micromonospora rosaria]KXK63839.1 hypothetical protein AWW66_01285 [Micromonospora rosaria]